MANYLSRAGYHIPYDVGNMDGSFGRRTKVSKNFGPVPEMWEVELGDEGPSTGGRKVTGVRGAGDWSGMVVSPFLLDGQEEGGSQGGKNMLLREGVGFRAMEGRRELTSTRLSPSSARLPPLRQDPRTHHHLFPPNSYLTRRFSRYSPPPP